MLGKAPAQGNANGCADERAEKRQCEQNQGNFHHFTLPLRWGMASGLAPGHRTFGAGRLTEGVGRLEGACNKNDGGLYGMRIIATALPFCSPPALLSQG